MARNISNFSFFSFDFCFSLVLFSIFVVAFRKKEIDQEVDHLLNCDESDVTIDVSEKDEEKELNPEQLTTVSTIVSQNDTVNEEKQDGDNLVSFQIGGDDISYKATDISPTVPNNKNNNTFSDNVPMNSQYATVDSVDSVRFAKHATVFTVPRHKHSIKKKVSGFSGFLFI